MQYCKNISCTVTWKYTGPTTAVRQLVPGRPALFCSAWICRRASVQSCALHDRRCSCGRLDFSHLAPTVANSQLVASLRILFFGGVLASRYCTVSYFAVCTVLQHSICCSRQLLFRANHLHEPSSGRYPSYHSRQA